MAVPRDKLGRKLKEKTIQASILRWLKSQGYLHWRQNSGALFVGKRMIRLGAAGLPDIVVILAPKGRFVGLEVKRKGTYQNPSQKAFEKHLKAVGGAYYVVRSLREAKEALEVESEISSDWVPCR